MFGSKQKQATNAAVEALRPIVGIVQHNYGLPSDFWNDPYVIGFFNFMIGHHAKLATRGQIGGKKLGYVLSDVFTALSNMNGAVIVRRMIELDAANDPDFNLAADHAVAICFYQMGILKNEASHPLVQAATQISSGSQSRDKIGGIMFAASFIQEIERRFSLKSN